MKRADKVVITLDATDIKVAIVDHLGRTFPDLKNNTNTTVTLTQDEGKDFTAQAVIEAVPRACSNRTLLTKWSRTVRNADGNKCIVCGSTKFVQAHHLLPEERYPELKYDLMNGVTLCPRHHKFGKFSAHRNPFWFVGWFRAAYPYRALWVVSHIGREEAAPMRRQDNYPIREIVVHTTMTTPEDTPTVKQYVMDQFAEGYLWPVHHYCINRQGGVAAGRPEPHPSPFAAPYHGIIVILLLGGLDASGEFALPAPQRTAALRLIADIKQRHPGAELNTAAMPEPLKAALTEA